MSTPPGFGDVSLKFNLATYNRPAYCTFGVDPAGTDPAAIAGDIVSSWMSSSNMNPLLDSNATMSEVTVRLGTDGGEDIVGTAVNSSAGGASQASVTPNVSLLVYKRTARGGRRGRGRLYFPWLLATSTVGEDGVIGASTVTIIQGRVNAWRSDLSSRGCPMVLLHNPGKTSQGAPDVVTSLVVSNVVGTQRRRLQRS